MRWLALALVAIVASFSGLVACGSQGTSSVGGTTSGSSGGGTSSASGGNSDGCVDAGGMCGCAGSCNPGYHPAPSPLLGECPQPCPECGTCGQQCCLLDVDGGDGG